MEMFRPFLMGSRLDVHCPKFDFSLPFLSLTCFIPCVTPNWDRSWIHHGVYMGNGG